MKPYHLPAAGTCANCGLPIKALDGGWRADGRFLCRGCYGSEYLNPSLFADTPAVKRKPGQAQSRGRAAGKDTTRATGPSNRPGSRSGSTKHKNRSTGSGGRGRK